MPTSPCDLKQLLTVDVIRHLFPLDQSGITTRQDSLIANAPCIQAIGTLYQASFSPNYEPFLQHRRCSKDKKACQVTLAGSYQTAAVLCSLGSWLYHQIGFDIVTTFAQQKTLPCRPQKRNIDKFIAILIVFLEWRVRPFIHTCDQVTPNIIPTNNRHHTTQRIDDVFHYISNDPHALTRFKQAKITKDWFQKYAISGRTTYYEYETEVISCLITQLLQEIDVLQPKHSPSLSWSANIELELFVRYNEAVRRELNTIPDSSRHLADLFVPPPLSQLDPLTGKTNRTSYRSFAHSHNHLLILGSQGAGRTALLKYLGLQQPVDSALIWLPGEVVQSLSGRSQLNQVLETALTHLFGPQPQNNPFPQIEMLRRASRRVFLVDASVPITKALLTRLQDFGRVIATVEKGDFTSSPIPDFQVWDIIQIETWSPTALHGLIQKYGPTPGISIRGLHHIYTRGLPQTPLWTLPLRSLDTDENLAISDVARAIINHRLGDNLQVGGGYLQELRKLAWDLYNNPHLSCAPGAPSQNQLGTKACKKIIPWAQRRHILREMANGEIRFLHSAMQIALVAAYLIKVFVRTNGGPANHSFFNKDIPFLLYGTPDPGQVMIFLVNLLWRGYHYKALAELVHQIANAYLYNPANVISPMSNDELLTAVKPVGQIRRLAQFGGQNICEVFQDVAQERNMHALEATYQGLLTTFFDVGINRLLDHPAKLTKDDFNQMGAILAAFEPLPQNRAQEVAIFLLNNPYLFNQPGASSLFTPTIQRQLDQFFILRLGRTWTSAAEIQKAVAPLARQGILSPATIQLTFWTGSQPSSYELISALATRGDINAALALGELWKSASYPTTPFHFQMLLYAWSGSVFSLFPFIREVYLHDESLFNSRWRQLCHKFVEHFGDDINLLLSYVDLFTIPAKLLDCLVVQGLSQQILTFDATIAFSRMLKQASSNGMDRIIAFDVPREDEIAAHRTTVDWIVERLYIGDGLDDGILEYQSFQDRLFLFYQDQIPSQAEWEIANYYLLPNLPHPYIEFWALYTLTYPKRMSQGQLITAILLSPCELEQFNEEVWSRIGESPLLSEALRKRERRCQDRYHYG